MSYVPDFENDIFISYAHIDNQALTEAKGLDRRVSSRFGNSLARITGRPTENLARSQTAGQ
jgi:hypothetical protein